MHIVAIAWIYVVLMMAITERSVVAAIMTFLMYGVLPLAILLYVTGTSRRRRRAHLKKIQLAAASTPEQIDHTHPKIRQMPDSDTFDTTDYNRPPPSA